ncbi:MAG: tape measure protein [Lachnospiraceae bacterium]|nr:tape measure protein [Lachnospiraceae bacterium]
MGAIRTSIQLYDGMTPAIRSMINASNIMIASFERMNTASRNSIDSASLRAARAEMVNAEASIIQIDRAIDRARESQENFNRSVSGGNSAAQMLKRTMGQIGTALGVKKIISIADEFTQAKARLDLMNDGLQTTDELQNKIFQSAQRARAAYGDTVSIVSKLGILAGKAFSSNDEMIAFAELMNKNFIVGGASQTEQAAAMYQLTQTMAAGKLQGDEYRSIIENAPLLARSIEDYMINVQHAQGTMKDWASEGRLTADIIKNALFGSADEIEERFAKMPMTWGQVWTTAINKILMASQPLLSAISFIAQNWEKLEPIIVGVSTAVGLYALMMGIQAAATWLAVDANKALIITMLKNPMLWVAIGIGIVIAMLYKWVQAVGGVKVAWLITKDKVLSAVDAMSLGIKGWVNWTLDDLGRMKVSGLKLIDSFINGAISRINKLIGYANKVPGIAIQTISYVSNKAEVAAEEETVKSQRRSNELKVAQMESRIEKAYRQREIENAKVVAASNTNTVDYPSYSDDLAQIADNTGSMADSMDISKEDLKYMRDVAEREAINRYTTAQIAVDFKNTATINSNMDIDGVMNKFTEVLREAVNTSAEEVHYVV